MIFLKHNLMKNYMNANGSDDANMKSDILTSEIAKLIVNNPEKVVNLLNANSDLKIVDVPSTGKLVKYTSDTLFKSKAFATDIAKAIIESNQQVNFGVEGEKKKVDWGKTIESVSGLVNGLGNIFGGNKAKKAEAEASRARAESEALLYQKTQTLTGKKPQNVGMYVGIAIAGAAVIGAVIFIFKRS